MLNHAGEIVYEDLKCFTDGESIEKYISDGTTIKSLLSNDNEMWQLLLYSGYLTKDRKQKEIDVTTEYTDVYNLRISNKEIRKYFGNMFLGRFFGTEVKVVFLIENLREIGYFKIIDCNIRGIVSVNYDSIWANSKGVISIGELEFAQYMIDKKIRNNGLIQQFIKI